jgi:hypothetical protein
MMEIKPIRRIRYDIGEGDSAIYETMDYMWNYALRDVNEPLVQKLVRSLKGKTAHDTIRNIYNWVWRNVDYKLDPADYEMITSPIHFVNGNRKTGDCDCMTTLLVCLLESAGFNCAIKVISWRVESNTHVYAEVWYNGAWQTLDPTLKSDGFGKQDKKIKRFKRKTKKDMAILEVLADSNETKKSAERTSRKLFSNRRKCYGNDDWNRNSNNININFGTTTENAYNSTNTDGGRSVEAKQVPQLENIYNRYIPRNPIVVPPPTILQPDENGGYVVAREHKHTPQFDKSNSTPLQKENENTNKNNGSGGINTSGNASENATGNNKISSSVARHRKGVIRNSRPKIVPNVVRNYYQEFP